jgi:hypothetical protein
MCSLINDEPLSKADTRPYSHDFREFPKMRADDANLDQRKLQVDCKFG